MADSLESRVREELIRTRTEESYNYLMKNPEVIELVKASIEEQIMGRIKMAFGDELSRNDISEAKAMIRPEIDRLYSEGGALKEIAYQAMKETIISHRKFTATIKKAVTEMRESGSFDENAISAYQEAMKPAGEYFRLADQMMKRLTKIASETSIENAISKETVYAVTREMFPTEQDFRNYRSLVFSTQENILKNAKKAMLMDGKVGEMIAARISSTQKLMKKTQEMLNKQIEDMIKEVYSIKEENNESNNNHR